MRRTLLFTTAVVAALAIAVVLGLLALVGTSAGSAWLLSRVPGLQASGVEGRLVGGAFSVARVEVQAARTITVERLAWRDARWRWRPQPGAWVGLELDGMSAQRVQVGAAVASAPLLPPQTLRLPFVLRIDGARVQRLAIDGAGEVGDVQATRLALGDEGGRAHVLQGMSLGSEHASARADLRIETDAPFALAARVAAQSRDAAPAPWQGTLEAAGTLTRLELSTRLSSRRTADAALEARARLAPFAAWPIETLALALRDLDLASLAVGAPSTRLSGRADIDTQGNGQPIVARIALTNARSGPWDQGRLPLASFDGELGGTLAERRTLSIRRFDARLAGDGGRISGRGAWSDARAELEFTLSAIRPATLDTHLAPATLAGQATVVVDGLPAPDGSRPFAKQQRAELALALDGRLDARRASLLKVTGQIEAQRDGAAWRIESRGLGLRAGAAHARGDLALRGAAGQATRLATHGDLTAFDPTPWWPAFATRAAGGATQLDGRWQLELQWPAGLASMRLDAPAALALRGHGRLELAPSRVAGVALQGRVDLDGRQPGWTLDAEARVANQHAALQGRLDPTPTADRWRMQLDAPDLAALQPLLRLLPLAPDAAAWVPRGGTLSGAMQLDGRWPAATASGQWRARDLQAGHGRIAALDLQGRAGPDAAAPLALSLDLQGLALADGAHLDTLAVRIDGRLAEHLMTLDAQTPLRPPAWTDRWIGVPAGTEGSRIRASAEGRWSGLANLRNPTHPLAGRWQARLTELDWRARGVAGRGDVAVPWLSARDASAELRLDEQGRAVEVAAAPGRAQLLGATVQWKRASWRAAADPAAPAALDLDLELDPQPIAPWLQRAWPGAGLIGDLAVKGHARVQAGERFTADLVLERATGDLAYRDEDGTPQPFGLTDLRLGVAAEDGTWHFTQALAGANVGVLAGAQSLRVPGAARWPAADTPMQGVLEWRVADLGAWARFTPPGWRVAGTLRTSAALGGRFGAPEVEGEMAGSGLAIRNLLQGVDLRDGELALSLRGGQARVERFTFKGGDGTLRLTGGATLGAEPSARLALEAERFRLLGRGDRRLVASGSARLQLAAHALGLDGRFTVDEGLFDLARGDAPSLDSDVRVRGARWGPIDGAENTPLPTQRPSGAPREMRVAVAVDLGRDLKVRGRGLDARLAGTLDVSAPGGRLAVNGNVRTEGGQYAAYGQKLDIERGVLAFGGAVENPRLDILAVRPNLEVKVGVQVSGTAQGPRVRLVSEPEMSEYDKLSWLVLGRASDGLARTDTALLQRAALALLAGEGQAADAALLANLGLDEFSVRQQDSGEVRDTVVTLGKQLSRRWYVGYERGVNSTTGTWQLIYRVAQRFTLRARSGEDNALDAIWTWRWN